MAHTTKREMVEKAQGMADYEQRVMVVFRYSTGELHIRAAEDLDVEILSDDWAAKYDMTWLAVVAPAGTFSGYSATDILRAVVPQVARA